MMPLEKPPAPFSRRAFLGGVLAPALVAAALPLPAAATNALEPASRAAASSRTGWRVGLQAGHWLAREMPDEMSRLRAQTGTYGGGVNEWELNLDIARRAAAVLTAAGVDVDVLPSTVPPRYLADAFVALHADGDASGRLSGFKLARSPRSPIPVLADSLLDALKLEYGQKTGLPLDSNISRNMTGYYAFGSHRFVHAISPWTPAVILEMGFMTNARDLRVLVGLRDDLAIGVARGVLRFLRESRGRGSA